MTVTGGGPPEPSEVRTSLFQAGDFRGHWRLEVELKSGWPTRVWRAIHRDTDRIGVIKLLVDETKHGRFRREFELTRSVDNHWTPRALEADLDFFPFWIAFEYVEADTLNQVIKDPVRGPLRDETLDEFGRQLWEARTYFDGAGMAHRDLSARNVMLRRGDGRVVVVDWGTGRHDGADETRTRGALPCTPGFGAPEQVLGDGDVGRLADVWGWGSVMYYAATGRAILPATQTGYAEALRNSAPIDWSDVPERWLSAMQAALTPIEERDSDAVAAALPLRPHERELRHAIADAERAEAEAAALRAALDGKDAQLAELDRQRLAELEAREAAEEAARVRQSVSSLEVPNDERRMRPPAVPVALGLAPEHTYTLPGDVDNTPGRLADQR